MELDEYLWKGWSLTDFFYLPGILLWSLVQLEVPFLSELVFLGYSTGNKKDQEKLKGQTTPS